MAEIDFRVMAPGEFVASLGVEVSPPPGALDFHNLLIVALIQATTGKLAATSITFLDEIIVPPQVSASALISRFVGDELLARIVCVAEDTDIVARGQEWASVFESVLEHGDIRVIDQIYTPRIAGGSPWRDLNDSDRNGTLPEPTETPLALTMLANGELIGSERRAVRALFTPIDRVDLIPAFIAASDNPEYIKETLTEIRETIARYADPHNTIGGKNAKERRAEKNRSAPDGNTADQPTHDDTEDADTPPVTSDADTEFARATILDSTADGLAAATGAIISDDQARDALIGIGLVDVPAAIKVYTHVANQLPGSPRAQLLAIVGILYHLHNQPGYAREAVLASLGAAQEAKIMPPVVTRTFLLGHEFDIDENETARRWASMGSTAARMLGIFTPEYNPYTDD